MQKNKKAFTLIETLIAVFIFSIAMTLLSGTFSTFLKNFSNAKKTQKDFENAQYTINLMAKTIRTSKVISSGANNIRVYDYSQSNCLEYRLNGNRIQIAYSPTTVDTCTASTALATNADLTTDNIQSLSISTSAATIPMVTVSIVLMEAGQTSGSLPIQTTVSLRSGSGSGTPSTTYSCRLATLPPNSTPCSGTGASLTFDTDYALVASCASDQNGKCQSICNSGYNFSGGTCVVSTSNLTFPISFPISFPASF